MAMWLRRRVDYPGGLTALRLRLRRMLCFLKAHRLVAVAHELERTTGVFFDAHYMRQLLKMGRWMEADDYLQDFVPVPADWSDECVRLMAHLQHSLTFAIVAAGGPMGRDYASRFDAADDSPFYSRFKNVLHTMRDDPPRATMIWNTVAPHAVNKIMRLVADVPELKGNIRRKLPRNKPWDVIPLMIGTEDPKGVARAARYLAAQQHMPSPVPSFGNGRGYIRPRSKMLTESHLPLYYNFY